MNEQQQRWWADWVALAWGNGDAGFLDAEQLALASDVELPPGETTLSVYAPASFRPEAIRFRGGHKGLHVTSVRVGRTEHMASSCPALMFEVPQPALHLTTAETDQLISITLNNRTSAAVKTLPYMLGRLP